MSIEKITQLIDQGQEKLTGYQGSISSDHAYIHKGIAFTAFIDIGTISSVTRIGFKTPSVASGEYVHWRPLGISTSTAYVKAVLTEGDTYTGGTATPAVNRNRNLAATKLTNMQDFKKGVTSTPAGTVIALAGLGSAGNPFSRSGGGSGADEEILLIHNTNYVLSLTPEASTSVLLTLFWYEEDGYTA